MIIWRREFHLYYNQFYILSIAHILLVSLFFVPTIVSFCSYTFSMWSNTFYFCAFGAFIFVSDWILLVCLLFVLACLFFSVSKVNYSLLDDDDYYYNDGYFNTFNEPSHLKMIHSLFQCVIEHALQVEFDFFVICFSLIHFLILYR